MNIKDKYINVIKYFLVSCFAIIIIGIPVWMMLINSLKPTAEAIEMSLSFPKVLNLVQNYSTVIVEGTFLRGLKNTFILTAGAMILIIFLGPMASWVLARKKNKFTKYIYFMFISGILLPPAVVATIRLLGMLHIYGTYHGLIFFYTGSFLPFIIFFTTGFIKTIPVELEEAAKIDGANQFGIFFKIIFPLLKPVLLTSVVFTTLYTWNDFLYPFYFTNSVRMQTLTLGLYNFQSQFMYQTSWELVFADVFLVSLPLIIVFIFAQRYIIKGITGGAIKG